VIAALHRPAARRLLPAIVRRYQPAQARLPRLRSRLLRHLPKKRKRRRKKKRRRKRKRKRKRKKRTVMEAEMEISMAAALALILRSFLQTAQSVRFVT
jgi:hypothetical protein